MGVKDLIPKDKRVELVELLKTQSFLEAGRSLGLDEHLREITQIRNTVRRVWEDIIKNPEEYGVSEESINQVREKLGSRRASPAKISIDDSALDKSLMASDFKDISTGVELTRDDALRLLRKKMRLINEDEKELKKLNLATLTTTVGILFDKAQLAKGEATQNIAIHSKISKDMTPEERIKAIYEIREKVAEE